jgi:hypothetical protein
MWDYDNMEHPGSEDTDAIAVKRINPYTHEATLLHAGREIGGFQRVIAKDGKQMTVTLRRSTPPTQSVEVYEKEQ